MRALILATAALGLAACASAPKKTAESASQPPLPPLAVPAASSARALPLPVPPKASPYAAAKEDPRTRGDYVAGGLYKPGVADSTPDYVPDVDAIPEPDVIAVPRSRVGNRSSYTVLGKTYYVLDDSRGYVEQGIASYYGQKFHGRRTSNLEVYDMYAFTAAHKSLPLPSFARVTNLDNGKSVVVRVNDRGPFHDGRVIDLSYAAAVKLGITHQGTGRVEVRAVHPGDNGTIFAGKGKRAPAMGAVNTSPGVVRSALDRLVAAIPAGRKQRKIAGAESAAAAVSTTQVAGATPVASADASAASSADARFDMRRDGKPMGADEFEAWMKDRQIRVATGQPTALKPSAPTPEAAVSQAVVPQAVSEAPQAVAASASAVTEGLMLQVASFGARNNADRALTLLREAGIIGARLQDGVANGQPVWRLRIGPVAEAGEAELATRLASLGFGPPRRVRD
ncbi:septal ring lytic transglycosylase RlpA family protein [Lysobacter korlensis]|uniref:Endolytic peptidoglycan transglycosylase RlpA n=1 Tax=Lysobacter korlensis TaxID=553636 RepID=A0ABV6RI39_9GAMM